MSTITYSQVQELIAQLPKKKLPVVYDLITYLMTTPNDAPLPPMNFMHLPLKERRRIMKQQATKMVSYYEQTASEREEWQGGDFIDYETR